MSRRASSRGDRGKAPVYATSHGKDSSNNETIFVGEQAARVPRSHFDCEGNDFGPTGNIPIETQSRRRHSFETASISSKSRTISSGASSWCKSAAKRWASRGVMRAEDLHINIEVNFSEDEVHPDLGARRRSLRPRFPPHPAEANAHTGAVDKGIRDTHLQHGLKNHPSAQALKGKVRCFSFLVI